MRAAVAAAWAASLVFGASWVYPAAAGAGAGPTSGPRAHHGGASSSQGYWLLGDDGGVFAFGSAHFLGSMAGQMTGRPLVCMSSTPDGNGYWLISPDGGVYAFGSAPFDGSLGGVALTKPVVGMAPTPDGKGYWLVASDGGVFAFGDAVFLGSAARLALGAPVVAIAATTDGKGYWLVAADGGVFSYGDARFFGSTGGAPLNAPVLGMTPTSDGNGYWLDGADGGVFSYGDAVFYGSAGNIARAVPVVGMSATLSAHGYWMAGQDGGVFSYGDAAFQGSLGGTALAAPIVAVSGVGAAGGCQGNAVPAALSVPGGGGPAGEGQWVPSGRLVGSAAAEYTTTLRPYVGGTPAGVAWIDTTRSSLRLYAGPPSQPPGNYTYSAAVAPGDRPNLMCAFNSGFKFSDSNGGWYANGQTPVPLRNGAASLVTFTDGSQRVGMWGRDFTMGPDVVAVRQNLNLLIDGGTAAPDLSVGAWGAVIAGMAADWRSALGTDKYGNIIFVGGSNLYPGDLAHLMLLAGAVEAMELDINPQWVTFSTYATAPGQSNPSVLAGWNLVPGMYYGPSRFITASDRDFIAAIVR